MNFWLRRDKLQIQVLFSLKYPVWRTQTQRQIKNATIHRTHQRIKGKYTLFKIFYFFSVNYSRDQGRRKSRKKKRNILRDPEDRRCPLKKASSAAYNNSKQRAGNKYSIDTRINGHNILQATKKTSFFQKEESGKILINPENRLKIQNRCESQIIDKKKSSKMKSNVLETQDIENTNKINSSDLNINRGPKNQKGNFDRPLFRKKSSKQTKSRRTKKTKQKDDIVGQGDILDESNKNKRPLAPNTRDLRRQSTFDSKQNSMKTTISQKRKVRMHETTSDFTYWI